MKRSNQLFVLCFFILLFSSCGESSYNRVKREYKQYVDSLAKADYGKTRIIKQITDDRGYITILFSVGDPVRDTFGLDYLTPLELDSFKIAEGIK